MGAPTGYAPTQERYIEKANEAKGGVGYERRVITPGIMRDLRGHRVVPLLRDCPEGSLPRFMGSARFIDFCDDREYEERYLDQIRTRR